MQSRSRCMFTSSNAVKVVNSLDSALVIMVPDENLANFVQKSVEGKDIIPWPGYCPTHDAITVERSKSSRTNTLELRSSFIRNAGQMSWTLRMLSVLLKAC